MDLFSKRKAPLPSRSKNNFDRVILHLCVENRQPSLKTLPLGIKQKGILATCNYVARARGVKKLMMISEAQKLCPDLVIVEGENLSPFRDVSKRLYSLLRSYMWSDKIERLGLDESFMDVTDIITYNLELLNRHSPHKSYFCLSRTDPEMGFPFDATSFSGSVCGRDDDGAEDGSSNLRMRLLLASHLAHFLRMRIEDQGYTTACGIATNKILAKLVGDKNKPRNQTTLLASTEEDVWSFMDSHSLRKVPGIGAKTARILQGFVSGKQPDPNIYTMECTTTVGQVRTHPGVSCPTLEGLLSGPGSEKGIGAKIWALLHGIDHADVKPARNIPTQISIEDTYKGLNEVSEIHRELVSISTALLRRVRIDLLEEDEGSTTATPSASRKWLAHPKTIRLTTRPYTRPSENKPYGWAQASRSCPLPSFVFNTSTADQKVIVDKLVVDTLFPLFHKLNPARRGWNIGLLNVCVTNMTDESTLSGGRDIGVMFRQQATILREFTTYDDSQDIAPQDDPPAAKQQVDEEEASEEEDDDSWDQEPSPGEPCPICGHIIPSFALAAHERYHSMELEGD
ncbi:hypothetical protein QBC38DRAFT_442762 [Podospora fimiseda]|uniref:UmuC domain-containing protein n=1 Tax=Podospora fimiseda TaxID=252190 RepID=A0AAN7BRW4_9PEZI|nr:hypothetical protein QBC38DRAFT_442762 [Podospora fimiseda]